ncbi:hypothetical protein B0H19DRAFT_1259756 [Mycena capillaripes]|nr:hypothetical protein B0H19DRAFT_1259756 [Mycena capillaripes]
MHLSMVSPLLSPHRSSRLRLYLMSNIMLALHGACASYASFPDFPQPPSAPRRTRMYTRSPRGMYGISSAVNTRTTPTAVVPLRVFRRQSIYDEPAVVLPPRRHSWLKKIIPGLLRRPKTAKRLSAQMEDRVLTSGEEEDAPLVRDSRLVRSKLPDSHSASVKLTSKANFKLGVGIENRVPPGALRTQSVRHSSSFSGYVYSPEDDEELDENMPEVREALHVTAAIHAKGYRYECLDPTRRRHLEEFIDREGVGERL